MARDPSLGLAEVASNLILFSSAVASGSATNSTTRIPNKRLGREGNILLRKLTKKKKEKNERRRLFFEKNKKIR